MYLWHMKNYLLIHNIADLLEKDVRPDWNEFFEQAQKDKKAVLKRKKEQKNK